MSALAHATGEQEHLVTQWKSIYTLGAMATVITLLGIVVDMIVGSSTSGDLSTLPQTAVERFAEFQVAPLLGLYHLDLLNTINQLLMIPAYFALYAAHRRANAAYSLLALIIFLVATTIFVTTNSALPMMELSHKYAATTSDSQKVLLAAAGEAMLARGAHGSLGVFIGFLLPNVAGLLMSFVMLRAGVFSRLTAYLGIAGNILISIYVILVTFLPAVEKMAVAFAMPGGLLLLAWTVMFTIRLFQLGSKRNAVSMM